MLNLLNISMSVYLGSIELDVITASFALQSSGACRSDTCVCVCVSFPYFPFT